MVSAGEGVVTNQNKLKNWRALLRQELRYEAVEAVRKNYETWFQLAFSLELELKLEI